MKAARQQHQQRQQLLKVFICKFLTIENLKCMIIYYLFIYRNDGIIISISVWQVIVEAIFNITYIAWNIFLQSTINNLGISKVSITLFLIFFSYIILPSFYFLADQKFRSALKESGIMKAIWSALKQKYD